MAVPDKLRTDPLQTALVGFWYLHRDAEDQVVSNRGVKRTHIWFQGWRATDETRD